MIKRFNILFIAIALFAPSLFSYGGSIPAGLPTTFTFGAIDKYDNSVDLPTRWKETQGSTCWDMNYQYLTSGWEGWQSPAGQWAVNEFKHWETLGQITAFTYYYNNGDKAMLTSTSGMATWYNNLITLYKVIAANTGKVVIVHIEPDLLGFCQRDGWTSSSTASVASSGVADCSTYPNTIAGWWQATMALRDKYAPGKAIVAIHYSHWAITDDVFNSVTASQATIDTGVTNGSNYLNSVMGTHKADLVFSDPCDRDADWYAQKQSDTKRWRTMNFTSMGTLPGQSTWYRIGYILDKLSTNLGLRVMLWQVPVGNTFFKTCDNTNGHYRDNSAQAIIPSAQYNGSAGTPGDAYTTSDTTKGPGWWASKGVIGCLFGEGAYNWIPTGGDVCHLRDYHPTDNTTNPATSAYSSGRAEDVWGQATSAYADNEGGYIRLAVAKYCSTGKYAIGVQPTATRTSTTGPTFTRTPSFTVTPFICSKMIYDGDTSGYTIANGAVTNQAPATMTEGAAGGNPGNGMILNYVLPAATPYWQPLKWSPTSPIAIADNTTLRFEVKSNLSAAPQFIVVIDWGSTTYQIDVNNYVTGGISTTWQTAVIPLSVLKAAGTTTITEINFINGNNTAYIVYVDNIRLTGGACPTATPTISATFTRTRTATVTPTGTTSSTVLPSSTYTRTRTATPTSTATPTRTNTVVVPTATFTSTRTATSTYTMTNTPVPPTPTYTVTSTRTPTVVPPTNTFTATPSFTSTRTGTPTFTSTTILSSPTFTRTGTPTSTRTGTPTYTSTAIPPTFTYTSTQVSSQTYTPTRTGTPTQTFTVTYTRTRTGTPTYTETRTSVPSPTISNTWTPGFGTLTHTPTVTVSGTRTTTPTYTRTVTNTPSFTRTASPTTTSTTAPPATPTFTGTRTATPTLTLPATATYTRTIGPSSTATDIVPSSTFTSTRTYTPTTVPSVTNTPSYTRTATSTRTVTVTWTATVTRTSTRLPSPTPTETEYVTPTVTNTIDVGTQPDLVITGMEITLDSIPACPTGSEQPGTLVSFRNAGNADAGAFDIELNGQIINVAGLVTGGSGSVWFAGQATQGNASAVIDFNSDVAESNETNNSLTQYLADPTPVDTCTPVVTDTMTPTDTATAPPTETDTPAATETSTPAATRTATEAETPAETFTPTLIPVNTFTMTETPYIMNTYTATPSRTMTAAPTATFTRTPAATATRTTVIPPVNTPSVLAFVNYANIASFPNPVVSNNDMRIRFEINRSADKAEFYMFTASRRKIRFFEIPRTLVVNNLTQGSNELVIGKQELSDLSAGVYYYYITVDNAGQKINSKIEKIIILK